MADVQQTYKFKFEFDRKDVKKQLKEISIDVKDAISQIGDASDKVVIFKELVSYLSNVDKALDAFKTKHKDDFSNLFGNPDKEILGVLTEILNTTQQSAQAFATLKEKIAAAESGKANLSTLRDIAEEINELFVSIGRAPQIDIDEMFTGKGSKAKGTDFAGRIKLLNDTLAEFGVTYSGLQNKLKGGFGFGGGSNSGSGITKISQEMQREIDALNKQKAELQEIIDSIDGKDIKINITAQNDVKQIKKLLDEYKEIDLKIVSNEFNSLPFNEQNKLLAEQLRLATLLKNARDHINKKGGSNEAFDLVNTGEGMRTIDKIEKSLDGYRLEVQKKADQIKGIYADLIANIDVQLNQLSIDNLNLEPTRQSIADAIELMQEANRIMGEISYDSQNYDLLDAQLDSIIDKIKQLATSEEQIEQLDELLEVNKDAPENIFDELCTILEVDIPRAAEKARDAIDGMPGKQNGPSKQNISILAKQLQEIYNISRQIGDNEIGFAVDIDGAAYFVQSADHIVKVADEASVAVRALNESLTILGHTHPSGGGLFSAGDYRSAISQKRSGMNMPVVAVGSNAASLLNLDGVDETTLDQIERVLDRFKNSDDAVGPSVVKELQNILSTNGFSDALHVVDISNGMDALSEALLKLSMNATEVQTPLQKLQSLIQYYSGNKLDASNISRFADEWAEFENGAKSAAEVFDSVMYKLDATDLEGNFFNTSEKEYKNLSTSLNMIESGVKETGSSIDQAKAKLESFLELTKEIHGTDFVEFGDASDNVKIGKYVERLEVAKAELDALGDQGVLTAEQLNDVNTAFENAKTELRDATRHYDDYYGSHESYYDDYREQKDRAESAEGENSRLQRQLEIMNKLSDIDRQIALTYDHQVDQLDHLIEQRTSLLNEAINSNSIDEETLEIQRSITNELEERSKYIHDSYDKTFDDFYGELNQLLGVDFDKMGIEEIDGYLDRLSALYAKLQEAESNYLLGDDGGVFGNIQEAYDNAVISLNKAKAKFTRESGAVDVSPQSSQKLSELEDTYYSDEYYSRDELEAILQDRNVLINTLKQEGAITDEILAKHEAINNEIQRRIDVINAYDHAEITLNQLDDLYNSTDMYDLDSVTRLIETRNNMLNNISSLAFEDDNSGDFMRDEVEKAKLENSLLERRVELLKQVRQGLIGVDDVDDILQENGTLDDKLSRLGDWIYQSGLSDKPDKDGDITEELEAFEETYDRIILKLANGKKIEILPDLKGLNALAKFYDSDDGLYGPTEIEDVEFVRQEKFLKTKIESYEELCNVVERYNQLAMKGDSRTSRENVELDAILQRFRATKGVRTPDQAINDALAWNRIVDPFGGISQDNLSKYLGIQIPQVASVAEDAIEDVHNATKLIEDRDGQFALFDDATASVRKTETAVEDLNNAVKETAVLDGQISMFDSDYTKSDIQNDIVDSQEVVQLEALRQKLLEVKAVVDAKTQAFEEEYVTVDGVVDAEITSLQSLIEQLQEVITQVNLVNDAFSNINTNTPKVELKSAPVDQSSVDNENTYYLTDSRGSRKLMYRGINGTMTGLVSNRYHGGTFFTDLMSLAKRYAGIDGKVETANISMKNPLEIDAHEHQWNDIEYLGNSADEASKKIRQCRKELNELQDWAIQNRGLKINLLTEDGFNEFEQEIKAMISNDWYDDDELSTKQRERLYGYLEKAKQARQGYLDISNDDSNVYGHHDTNRFVELAKNAGYDGVVFRNIKDGTNEISNIVVTLQENQIHFVETLKTTFESLLTDFIGDFGKIEEFMSFYNEFKTDNSLFHEVGDGIRSIFGEQLDKYEELSMLGDPEIINEFLNKNKILGAFDKRIPGGLDSLLSMDDTEARIDQIVIFYRNALYELEQIQEAFHTKATSVEQYEREQNGKLTSYDKISTVVSGYSDRTLNDKESYKYADATIEDLHAKKDQAMAAANAFKELFASLDMETANPEQLKRVVDSFVNAIKLIDDAQSMATGIIENSIGAPDTAPMRDFHELGPIRDSLTADHLDILQAEAKQIEQIEIDAQKAQEQRLKSEQESANIVNQKTQVDVVSDADIQEEVGQLNRLKTILDEVKNAVIAKTKAFVDEGNTVGQVVGKEIAALNKLLEVIEEISPKIDAISTKIASIGPVDITAQNGNGNTDSSDSGTKTEDKFKTRVSAKKGAMTKYINELEGVQYVTDDTREKLVGFRDALDTVKTPKDLNNIIAKFEELQTEIEILKASFERTGLNDVQSAERSLLGAFNTLNIDQKLDVKPELDEVILQLETYKNAVLSGQKVELSTIEETIRALRQKIETYKEVNKEAKKAGTSTGGNASFGSTASINATAKYNSLTRAATSDQFANSSEVANALALYEQSYKRMIEMRDKLRAAPAIDDSDREAFKTATTECNNYAKALDRIIQNSLKLKGNKANKDDYMLGSDFNYSDVESRKAALADFAKQMYGVDVAATDFKDNWNKVVFAVDNGDGTFTQMTATFTDARNEIIAMAGETKRSVGLMGQLWDQYKGKLKSIFSYFMATISIYDVWRVVKQGVAHVKEIDSALTELKKVTDETDASYKQFLQDMSKTGAVIGATVKDLTSSAADWARLGSIAKSAPLYSNI